jgi:allantoate deiminase
MKSLCRSTNRTAIFKRDFVANDEAESTPDRMTPKLRDTDTLAREVVARCQTLARFSEDTGRIRRTFLSPPMRDCHREILRWLTCCGVTSDIDAVGNLHLLDPAAGKNAPRLLIGSHLDTVPDAGAYDGILGVVLAVALLTAIDRQKLPFAIEVIGFSEEEGVRFATPFIGSRALAGTLDDEVLNRQDAEGISIRKAIENFGLNPAEIPEARIDDNVLGYLEFHIEQGPVLDSIARPLGVVEAIVGQSRLEFTFTGHGNHAGTTPMNLRRDSLAAAAEWISTVERGAKNTSGLVATVGAIQVKPGAVNVIAAETRLTLDVRHREDGARERAVEKFTQEAHEVANRRHLSLQWHGMLDQPAVPMNPFLVSEVEKAIRKSGSEPHRMVSGAGHDAMILAAKVPTAMIFLRTPDGVSHDPAESVAVEDVSKAIDCGLYLLDQLSSSSEFQRKTQHA